MDYKPLPVGFDNFEMVITRGYYYIDKTLFIKELIDKKNSVNLFTRPRRFGKTLNMSMLQYFFEDARDDQGGKVDNSYLFDGLKIMDAGEKYLAHMGQHPVISLTLKDVGQADFDAAMYEMIRIISGEFKRHSFVIGGLDNEDEKSLFYKLMNREADRQDYYSSLWFLSKCLEKYYGKKPVILIDEYDVPLERAHRSGYYTEMVDFMRTWFSSALKTNSTFEFAVITGCLRISKESIFTGLNNLDVISILNDKYSEHFGFTDDEVKKMCEDTGIPGNYETVKQWYDGYIFGEAHVYNPWSVIKYMSDHADHPDAFPQAYWANTSSNSIVRELIDMAGQDTKQEIERLIAGENIEKPIHEDITYDEIYASMDNLWNFMFFTGYFKKIAERIDEDDVIHLALCIPNREVRYIFKNKVQGWFHERITAMDRTGFFHAVATGDISTMEKFINSELVKTISYHDASEAFYHGFIAGLISGLNGYVTRSNREQGDGRPDILMEPLDVYQPVIIMELKCTNKITGLEQGCDDALRQIEERHYDAEFKEEGYPQYIKYGICFFKKTCRIKVYRESL